MLLEPSDPTAGPEPERGPEPELQKHTGHDLPTESVEITELAPPVDSMSQSDLRFEPDLKSEPEPEPELEPGTLADFMDRLSSRIPVDRIEEIWIFPPRKAGFGDSTVLAVSAFEADPDRRRIATGQFSVTKDPKGKPIIEEAINEHGTAPADRVSRVIEGVLRRMGDDLSAVPRHITIAGDLQAWARLREGS